jgi:outer membrane protein TolC
MTTKLLIGCIALWMGASNLAHAQEMLSLQAAQQMAKKNNLTIKAARERIFQADLLINKAWVMLKPQIQVAGTYTHHSTEVRMGIPVTDLQGNPPVPQITGLSELLIQKKDSFGAVASMRQPVFVPRAYTAIKNAKNAYQLTKISAENLEDFVLHSVAIAYFSALTSKKIQASAKKAVALRKEHQRVAQARFQVGEQAKINVLRAQIDVTRAEQDLKQARNSVKLTKEAIAMLVGCPPDFFLQAPGLARLPADGKESFIQKALAQRRDLTVANINLKIAETLKQDSWFRFLPTLSLTGMYSLSDVKGFTDEYHRWNLGLTLAIPLYDGGLRCAQLEEASSRIRLARFEIEDKQRAIKSEIRQLWLKMEMAEANLKKARRALDLATQQASLSKTSFKAGLTSNLEMLDSNHILFISEVNVAQLEFNLQVAIMNLNKAVLMFRPDAQGKQ